MKYLRKEIKRKHESLEQLEEYESLLECLNGDGGGHWWKIVTPNKEISIYTEETRKNFKIFIIDEIVRIRSELGVED